MKQEQHTHTFIHQHTPGVCDLCTHSPRLLPSAALSHPPPPSLLWLAALSTTCDHRPDLNKITLYLSCGENGFRTPPPQAALREAGMLSDNLICMSRVLCLWEDERLPLSSLASLIRQQPGTDSYQETGHSGTLSPSLSLSPKESLTA